MHSAVEVTTLASSRNVSGFYPITLFLTILFFLVLKKQVQDKRALRDRESRQTDRNP